MSHTSTLLLVLALTLIGFTANANTYSEKQIQCLAQNIYHEARGEPYEGQLAVAYVTLNRTQDKDFKGSICDVVYQKSQFSWTKHKPKIKEQDAWSTAKGAALEAIILHSVGIDNTHGALYFNSGKRKRHAVRIGNHTFY